MEHGGALLRDGAIMLGFGLACVLLFRKLGLGATLGYLVAGALVGPQVLDLIHGGAESVLSVSEFGITLLLFLVGLELNPTRLWRLKRDIFGLGLAQVVLCGIAVTGLLLVAQFSWQAALAIGFPLALSSTAQVLPMLQSAGRLKTPFGERAFSILLFQDLSIVPLITLIAVLSRAPVQEADAMPGWMLAILTVAAIVGLVLAGRFVLRPLFRLIGVLGEREMFVFAGLFTVVASAAVMGALGLSTALGAFIAGVMLADSPYRHELEADVEPFRSVLLGFFFLAVGMVLDLGAIAERPLFVLGMAAALIATKAGVIFGLARLFGMKWREALALGLLLSQGGEFGFVLFAQAQGALLIDPEAASLFGAVVTLSMATTPFLMRFTRRLRADPEQRTEHLDTPMADGASAIVVGYGRFGQTVAQMLILQRIRVTLIDTDPEMIEVAGTFGAKVFYGDGLRLDLLRQAGAADAQLLMFCPDGDGIDAGFLHSVKATFPNIAVFARAYDRRSMMKMAGGPIAGAVREVFESAICMGRMGLACLDVPDDEIDEVEREYRARDEDRLREQSDSGDLRAGIERIITENRMLAEGR